MFQSRNWPLTLALTMIVSGCGCLFRPKPWPAVTSLPSPGPPTPEFSVVWDAHDLNGIPLNPQWAAQRDLKQLPPVPKEEARNACVRRPDRPDCTAQATTIDKPPFIGWGLLCDLVPGSRIHGHVDWLPATYTGYLRWFHLNLGDSDYNFRLFPEGERGLTTNNQEYVVGTRFIELEFDSRETAERFATPTWVKFADAAASPDLKKMDWWLDPKTGENSPRVVVTGLFNLDCEHDCRSELHPLYALAVQTDDHPDDTTWAIFVRNWGNGGSCSGLNHQLELQGHRLQILLPSDNPKAATILRDKVEFAVSPGSGIPFPDFGYISGMGYAVTFTLPDPRARGLAELVLHLQWPQGAPQPPRAKLPLRGSVAALAVSGSSAEGAEESAEGYLESLFSRIGALPPVSVQPHVALQFESQAFAAPSRDQMMSPPASIPVKTFKAPVMKALAPGQTAPWRVSDVTDEVKQISDEDLFRSLCAAYRLRGEILPSDRIPDLPKLCNLPEMQ